MIPLWGWKPVPAGKPDPRWLAVKDARCGLSGYGDPPAIAAWVAQAVRYAPEAVDRWSPPRETLRRGYGDCEDLALLKRALWLDAGAAESAALFVLVWDMIQRRDHAVILLHWEGRWFLLDSFTSRIIPVNDALDYAPRLAFSGARCWTFGR